MLYIYIDEILMASIIKILISCFIIDSIIERWFNYQFQYNFLIIRLIIKFKVVHLLLDHCGSCIASMYEFHPRAGTAGAVSTGLGSRHGDGDLLTNTTTGKWGSP